ncbi:MAG TPA: heme ABC exporter ATP-binding protein CcmA [Terriglobales bacterium]|nr:heme ABC exporter ATP-binding protein CcmA [Terriglobales bacterium]
MAPLCACQNVSRFFGERAVLRQVSFACAPGELLYLGGANGAGKTTLLRILAGALRATAGAVTVGEAAIGSAAARRATGYLSHQSLLHPALTVEENLEFYAALFDLADARAAVRSALARVGAQGFAQRRAGELSQGMKQKAALARCLLHRPRLLLLDEPFASLDRATVSELREILRELRDAGLSVIVTSHQTEPLEGLVDRRLELEQGRLR